MNVISVGIEDGNMQLMIVCIHFYPIFIWRMILSPISWLICLIDTLKMILSRISWTSCLIDTLKMILSRITYPRWLMECLHIMYEGRNIKINFISLIINCMMLHQIICYLILFECLNLTYFVQFGSIDLFANCLTLNHLRLTPNGQSYRGYLLMNRV